MLSHLKKRLGVFTAIAVMAALGNALATEHDDQVGIACLGGECFGEGGNGFLRFSCAESNERLSAAIEFLATALARDDRVASYLEQHPKFGLSKPYGD